MDDVVTGAKIRRASREVPVPKEAKLAQLPYDVAGVHDAVVSSS
mgnify:CR=1 FL=1